MNSSSIVLPSAYFPPISYFSKVAAYDIVFVEGFEHFQKQTIRNRCQILGANNVQILTVPILKEQQKKYYAKDARISYVEDWQKQHWKSIEAAYRSSPFYEYYIDDIYPFFKKKYNFLFDLNFELMEMLKENLQIEASITPSTQYTPNNNELNIKSGANSCKTKEYTQVFSDRRGFVADLSVLDLLFNTGSEAIDFF